MATKTISITEDVYERLVALKIPGESFSEELRRLAGSGSIMNFAGIWKDIPEKEFNTIKKRIRERRKEPGRHYGWNSNDLS